MTPQPAAVRYNDWRQIRLAPPEAFSPVRPVSVIVPYYDAPRALALTLAALEGQSWPRELLEVVIVDDGSPAPLAHPRSTPLTVKVVHQERRGFGAARARNTGVRAASHDILLFLDGDMLPEAGWVAAHARWHHGASGIVTLGFRAFVGVEGVRPETIRERSGSLRELFAGREADRSWVEAHMMRTGDLTSRDDAPFQVVVSANLAMGRALFEESGGFDESITRWGGMDIELGYRLFTRGAVLVPVRDAFAWHQGRWAEERARKRRSRERLRPTMAHLIAHDVYRPPRAGCGYAVPRYVVTVAGSGVAAERIARTVERVLADPVHDLVVRIETPGPDERAGWLRDRFGPDPRVRVPAVGDALDEFPTAAFHVAIPAGARLCSAPIRRLRARLGLAVTATVRLAGGATMSITRTWALHRSRRTGGRPADFGDARRVARWRLCLPELSVERLVRGRLGRGALRRARRLVRRER